MKALTDPSLRALVDKRAHLVDQRKALLDKAIKENRGLSTEELKENLRLQRETEQMDALIDYARIADPDGQRSARADEPRPGLGGQIERGQRAEFLPSGYTSEHRDLASFVKDVAESRTMSMISGAAGGWLVPDNLLPSVQVIDPETMVITARATTIGPAPNAPDAPTQVPSLDVGAGKGILGGIQMVWLAEGAAKQSTEPELAMIDLKPQEIAGYVPITDKLLRNAGPELDTFLRRVLNNALGAAQEQAFLTGTGIGQPLGIWGSPCRQEVARAGAGAIAYADLVNMITVFGPDAWSRGLWLCSQSALPAILGMVDPGAAGTLLIRPSELQAGRPPSLLGLPLYVSTRTPVLGATGDIALLDPTFYIRKLGYGPSIEISNAPRFLSNQSVLKIFANVDGQPWLQGPGGVLMEDGVTTLSPFVLLAA